jgi:hypothetical protein
MAWKTLLSLHAAEVHIDPQSQWCRRRAAIDVGRSRCRA